MYNPPAFAVSGVDALATIARIPFGHLCAVGGGRIESTPMPVLVDDAPPGLIVRGHLARNNPFPAAVAEGTEVVLILTGPDAYVSPSAYPGKRDHGRVVPTWNYVVAHVRGTVTFPTDRAWLLGVVQALTDRHEATRPSPWAVSDAPPDYLEAMLRGIIGVEIAVHDLDVKAKLSQNRPEADRAGVAADLVARADPLAAWMRTVS
jgi:transcriptional regulator